jgi:predicted nuclease of predicted toxin-antitoxin system
VRFLVDTNLPPALAKWLVERGYQADHAAALLSPQADDPEIWTRARELSAIVVTKDQDYLDLAARDGVGTVVLIRCGNLKLGAFAQWFAARAEAMEQLLAMGERVVELR